LGEHTRHTRMNMEFVEPLPINTASIELRGAEPDVRELRVTPIPKLGLS